LPGASQRFKLSRIPETGDKLLIPCDARLLLVPCGRSITRVKLKSFAMVRTAFRLTPSTRSNEVQRFDIRRFARCMSITDEFVRWRNYSIPNIRVHHARIIIVIANDIIMTPRA